MPDSPSVRLVSLNRQAIAIIQLGIPLDFGLGADPVQRLREINDRLLSTVGETGSAESMLMKHSLPERYRAIARMLLEAEDPAPIFDSLAISDLEQKAASAPVRQAFSEPLVLAVMVYFCAIFLCKFTIPQIEAEYFSEGRSPQGITSILIAMKDSLAYWAIGFPVAVLLTWWAWRALSGGFLFRWFPGGGSYCAWLTAEAQSRRLAALVGSDLDPDTSIQLARISTAENTHVRPIAESIVRDAEGTSRAASLIRLSNFYRFLSEDRRKSVFAKVPAIMALVLGSAIVFGYALATFLPWIEILSNLGGLEASSR